MRRPDNSGEIIWMLDRMMSLCFCILATANKHQTLLTAVNVGRKYRESNTEEEIKHIFSFHTVKS